MKTPQARTGGPRGRAWLLGLLLGLIALLVLGPLAVFAPAAGALGFGATALVAAILLLRRVAAVGGAHEVLSREIGVVSERLIRIETVVSALARVHAEAGAQAAAAPPGDTTVTEDRLAAGIEEVTAEIGLLSGIVRELATVVAAQDGDIARLKVQPREVPAPVPAPAPVAAAPPPTAISPPATVVPPAAIVPPAVFLPPRAVAPQAAMPPALPVAPLSARPPDEGTVAPPRRDPEAERAVVEAFDGEGLEVFLQPVVTLPQRRVVSYEALARLRVGGELLTPDAFLPVLERHGRTTALDRRMLQRVASIARHLQGRGSSASVAYGLSPYSLFEPGFLRSLGRLVAEGADMPGRLAVALPQASWRSLDAEQAALLAELRGQVGFALDRPTDLRFDPQALAERGVGQVKVGAALLLQAPETRSEIAIEDLVAALGRSGIRLVATGIENEAEVPDLIDLDVPLAQGGVFAAPRAVRGEILAPPKPAPPAAPEPEPPSPPASPPPQRRAFRDFLRRAG